MTLSADLSGKRALVTGASSGLGLHFAKLLHASGADVVLGARRQPRLEQIVADLGERAVAVQLDVTDAASVEEMVRALGPIDVLVNNAGMTETVPILDQDEAGWSRVIDTNLSGAFRMATAVARTMQGERGGSIINVASILGLRQAAQVTAYAVAKAGLIQLTKQLALELARYGIRVNAIAPGYFETDINRAFFQTPAGAALIRRIPQRRLGQPSELDGALLLLASDASSFMTGSVITVDGGHLVSSL